jgi:hypothetical protein
MVRLSPAKICIAAALTLGLAGGFAARPAWHWLKGFGINRGDVANFVLIDHTGESHELYGYAGQKGIVIVSQGNGCPIVRKYTGTLKELKSAFESRGIRFLMLNANLQDTRLSVANEVLSYDMSLPILMDPSQTVARDLGFTRTSETILIDTETWRIVYRGGIDDRMFYGGQKQQASVAGLSDAIEDLLHGRPVRRPEMPALGCAIAYSKASLSEHSRDIAPIVSAPGPAMNGCNGKLICQP